MFAPIDIRQNFYSRKKLATTQLDESPPKFFITFERGA